ncbi:MAG TPA: HPr family phosphocarrier protein [Actinotalea sp.]
MSERRATIMAASGLHARPASRFTQAAAASGHAVTIGRAGEPGVLASSILMVMGLRLQHGEQVVLSAPGASAAPALAALADLLGTDLDAADET